MKDVVIELTEANPGPYSGWEERSKNTLMGVLQHYINNNDKLAEELIMMLESWTLDEQRVRLMSNIIGGTPLS